MLSIKFKNIPLLLIIGFNLFTLFVFYTAPIHWETNNLLEFLIFSLTCQGMIVLGYNNGYKKKKKKDITKLVFFKISQKQISFLFWFYILTFLIKYAYILRFKIFDIKGMFNFLLIGFADPHLGYALSLDESRPVTVSWSIYFLISIINQLFFVIGFLNWKQLSRIWKFIFVLFLALEIFFWMGRGTNFGTISLITTLVLSLVCGIKKADFKRVPVFRFFLIGSFLFIVGIFAFSLNMSRRGGTKIVDLQYFNIGRSKVNESSEIFNIIPENFQENYLYIINYLSQGYYNTSLAFDLSFKPTYFMGNNFAILNFAKLLGFDVWKDTYVYRLNEKGVDPLVNWHSAYLWFASDVSFLGVPFLFLFFGFLFGYSWSLVLNYNDFLSKILVIIIGNMFLFLFANNTYLASVFYSFTIILPVWLLTRLKFSK